MWTTGTRKRPNRHPLNKSFLVKNEPRSAARLFHFPFQLRLFQEREAEVLARGGEFRMITLPCTCSAMLFCIRGNLALSAACGVVHAGIPSRKSPFARVPYQHLELCGKLQHADCGRHPQTPRKCIQRDPYGHIVNKPIPFTVHNKLLCPSLFGRGPRNSVSSATGRYVQDRHKVPGV